MRWLVLLVGTLLCFWFVCFQWMTNLQKKTKNRPVPVNLLLIYSFALFILVNKNLNLFICSMGVINAKSLLRTWIVNGSKSYYARRWVVFPLFKFFQLGLFKLMCSLLLFVQLTTPLEHCEWLNKLLMETWPNYISPKLSMRFASIVEVIASFLTNS